MRALVCAAITVFVGAGCALSTVALSHDRPWRLSRPYAAALIGMSVLVIAATSVRFATRPWLCPAYLVLAAVSVPLSTVDIAEHRLPDRILKPALAGVAVLLAFAAAHSGMADAYVRAVLAALLLYAGAVALALLTSGGLGWGDTKLLALSGLCLGYLGWGRVLFGMCLAFAAASVAAAVPMTMGRRAPRSRIAIGPFLLGATLIGALAW